MYHIPKSEYGSKGKVRQEKAGVGYAWESKGPPHPLCTMYIPASEYGSKGKVMDGRDKEGFGWKGQGGIVRFNAIAG